MSVFNPGDIGWKNSRGEIPLRVLPGEDSQTPCGFFGTRTVKSWNKKRGLDVSGLRFCGKFRDVAADFARARCPCPMPCTRDRPVGRIYGGGKMKRIFVTLFGLLVLGNALLWNSVFSAESLRISEETTRFTEPLNVQGKRVDYFRVLERELYPPQMKTDENGYRMIVRALGDRRNDRLDMEPGQENDPALKKQTYGKLGLDFSQPPTLNYEAPETYFLPHPTEGQTMVYYGPWGHTPVPKIENWLDKNGAALDRAVEALKNPLFCVPLVRENENVALHELKSDAHSFVRDLSHGLRMRAFHRQNENDWDGAIEDMIAAHRLARFMTYQPHYRDLLFGVSLENSVHKLPLRGKPDRNISLDQLRRFFAALDELPPRKPIPHAREMDRLYVLDTVFSAYLSENKESWSELLHTDDDFHITCDWNTVFRRINEDFDRMIALMELPPWSEEETIAETSDLQERSKLFADRIFRRLITQDMASPEFNAYCRENRRRLATALLIYEMEHGKLPVENWQQATTPLLGKYAEYGFHSSRHDYVPGKTSYALVRYASEEKGSPDDAILLVLLKEPMPSDTVIDAAQIREYCIDENTRLLETAFRNGTVGYIFVEEEQDSEGENRR